MILRPDGVATRSTEFVRVATSSIEFSTDRRQKGRLASQRADPTQVNCCFIFDFGYSAILKECAN